MNKILLPNFNSYKLDELISIAENAPDIIARFDNKFRHLYVNKAVERVTGIPREEFIGKTNDEMGMPEDKVTLWNNWLGDLFNSELECYHEFDFLTPQGIRYYQMHGVPEFDDKNAIRSVLVITRDITEQKNIKKELEVSKILLDEIFEHSQMLIAYMDSNFNFIKVSRDYAMVDDKEPSFYIGKNHFDLFPNPDNEEIFKRVRNTGKPYKARAKPFIYESNLERGITYWDWDLLPIKDLSERITNFLLILVDVSLYKKMEAELIKFSKKLEYSVLDRTERLILANELIEKEVSIRTRIEDEKEKAYVELDQIFNATNVGMTVVDNDFNYIRMNKRFIDMFNISDKDVVGKKCHEVQTEWMCHTEDCPIKRVLKGKKCIEYEIYRNFNNGRIRIYNVNAVPFISKEGNIIGIIKNYIDITEQRDVQKSFINGIEMERQRIVRDLHDIVGQNLTAAGFLVESIRNSVEPAVADKLAHLIKESIAQTRNISKTLFPIDIKEVGIKSALIDMASNIEKIYKVETKMFIEDPKVSINNEVAMHLYYIAREATNNAIKHGNPEIIEIGLRTIGSMLTMVIKDNGKEKIKAGKHSGIGFKIMRYRAQLIGADLDTQNNHEGGFTVALRLKLM